jgi:hypothetical protein
MSQSDLERLVDLLRTELARARAGDPEALSHMEPLLADLRGALREGAASPGLRERLESLLTEFEVEHPRLTAIVNDVMVSLGNLGI